SRPKADESNWVVVIDVVKNYVLSKANNQSVKKTLTIPKWLNDLALEQNINFSQVLQEALKDKLQI
ncbi:TPA: type II toxin-antitoxin system HicB family antitoxin, partial [Streptococcus pyogenes]|nr:type II toxin-antitoxin system HicB family antitoxin [Streptococcus pyogenes]